MRKADAALVMDLQELIVQGLLGVKDSGFVG